MGSCFAGTRRPRGISTGGFNGTSKHAVDEFGRGFTTEELGQFNRLVYGGSEWHCSIAVQGFIESDAQDIAVHRGHLRKRPQWCALLDECVDRGSILQHTA